jgi:hypothetical protein
VAGYICRLGAAKPEELLLLAFLVARHSWQRLGSLVYPFPAKNSCSLTVKMKSAPQSEHFRGLSAKLTR